MIGGGGRLAMRAAARREKKFCTAFAASSAIGTASPVSPCGPLVLGTSLARFTGESLAGMEGLRIPWSGGVLGALIMTTCRNKN